MRMGIALGCTAAVLVLSGCSWFRDEPPAPVLQAASAPVQWESAPAAPPAQSTPAPSEGTRTSVLSVTQKSAKQRTAPPATALPVRKDVQAPKP